MRVDHDEAGLRAENARLREALRDAERRLEALAKLGRVENPSASAMSPFSRIDRLGLELSDLRQRQEFVEGILESSGDCIDVLDLDARLLFMSPGGQRIMQIDDLAPLIGFPWVDFWDGDSRGDAEAALAVALAGGTGRFVGAAPTAKGLMKWWDVVLTPMRDGEGRVAHLLSVSRDMTRARAAEDALRESETRLRLAQAAGGIGVFETDLQSGQTMLSEECRAIYGLPPGEIYHAADIEALVLPEDRASFESLGARSGSAGRAAEYRIRRADTGRVVHVSRHADIVPGPDGSLGKFAGVIQDISERKEAQAQQRLLMQELAHRVKNTLAIIKSIANQTLKGLEDHAEVRAFDARLLALGRAFDVLLQESWAAARIVSVVEGAVSPHGGARRFSLQGPDIMVGPKSALSLVLLLHELCTNAAKYGALSQREGRIDLFWRILPSGAEPELMMEWIEKGGPPVSAPNRKGFGSRIVSLGLAGARNADVEYRPEGLCARFRAPLSMLES
ncbi:MAG TPA: HWE histidine kinase domain-containing protein [Mesorhizobium sp.]|jgi:PAS domain S-box-containing protein|nr:HWE histidine kinase domain-containing protein [Mesorhizobium sp.]